MKVKATSHKEKKKFKPFGIKIIFENQHEVDIFCTIFNFGPINHWGTCNMLEINDILDVIEDKCDKIDIDDFTQILNKYLNDHYA